MTALTGKVEGEPEPRRAADRAGVAAELAALGAGSDARAAAMADELGIAPGASA